MIPKPVGRLSAIIDTDDCVYINAFSVCAPVKERTSEIVLTPMGNPLISVLFGGTIPCVNPLHAPGHEAQIAPFLFDMADLGNVVGEVFKVMKGLGDTRYKEFRAAVLEFMDSDNGEVPE